MLCDVCASRRRPPLPHPTPPCVCAPVRNPVCRKHTVCILTSAESIPQICGPRSHARTRRQPPADKVLRTCACCHVPRLVVPALFSLIMHHRIIIIAYSPPSLILPHYILIACARWIPDPRHPIELACSLALLAKTLLSGKGLRKRPRCFSSRSVCSLASFIDSQEAVSQQELGSWGCATAGLGRACCCSTVSEGLRSVGLFRWQSCLAVLSLLCAHQHAVPLLPQASSSSGGGVCRFVRASNQQAPHIAPSFLQPLLQKGNAPHCA